MLLAIIIASLLITAFIGVLIALPFYGTGILETLKGGSVLTHADNLDVLKFFQIVNQIGVFIVPPIVFALLVSRRIWAYLGLVRPPRFYTWLAGSALVLFSLPFLHWLGEVNEMIRLPEFLAGVERWMQQSEVRARELTEAFVDVDTFGGLMVNVVMIALLPAVGEELLFRGALLRIFRDWSNSAHFAVVITAVLFSALHMQFYGFLPRMVLGVFLGYMFVWSGSLWVPIIVHFVNNVVAVMIIFFMNRAGKEMEVEDIGASSSMFVIILSLLLVISLILFIYANERRK